MPASPEDYILERLIHNNENKISSLLGSNRIPEAVKVIQNNVGLLRTVLKGKPDPLTRELFENKIVRYEKQLSSLQNVTVNDISKQKTSGRRNEKSPGSPDEYLATAEQMITRSNLTWDDVSGLDEVKAAVRTSVVQNFARPDRDVKLTPARNILLYGPPGVGKTLIAEAISSQIRATFYNVKIRDVLSMYVGVAPKIISSIFESARSHAPALIFLDEIDSIAISRDNDRNSGTGLVQTLLTELQGFGQKDSPFVMFLSSTNVPWQIDYAVMSRFQQRIYVPLPDLGARMSILRLNLEKKGFEIEPGYEELGRMTDGYSGRSIVNACNKAISYMLDRSNPDLEKLDVMDPERIRKYSLKIHKISRGEIERAFGETREVMSKEKLERFEMFRNESGGA
ncbi:MAG: ATP-binding protein [Candidatus Thermoplasmatota archaeon]|nr:ATP-binding protein [Candidatus Thermoplasmatota archaeon]